MTLMAPEAELELCKRAGAFALSSSWRWKPPAGAVAAAAAATPAVAEDASDVDRLARFALPLEHLQAPSASGETSELTALCDDTRDMVKGHLCDPFFTSVLEQVEERLTRTASMLLGSRMRSCQVPFQHVRFMLGELKRLSTSTQELLGRMEDAQSRVEKLQRQAETDGLDRPTATGREELFSRPAHEVLGSLRDGWKEQWWQSTHRQQALELLEARNQQWACEDELDQVELDRRESLQEQLKCTKAQCDALRQLERLRDTVPSVTEEVQAEFAAVQASSERLHAAAMRDLQLIDEIIRDPPPQPPPADAPPSPAALFLEENRRRMADADGELIKLDVWYAARKEQLTLEANKPSSFILALQQEVALLREQLQAREAELARELDLWSAQSLEASKSLPDGAIHRLEREYRLGRDKWFAVKDLLAAERSKALEDLKEPRRPATLMDRLRRRRDALQAAGSMYSDVRNATDTAKRVVLDLEVAIRTYVDSRLVEQRQRRPFLVLQALEVGALLNTSVKRVDGAKRERIGAVDATMVHLNLLLEFAVDTQDPNAHRFHAILEQLTEARQQAQEALAENARVFGWMKRVAEPFFRELQALHLRPRDAATLKRLQSLYPVFFSLLGDTPPGIAPAPTTGVP
eukprot:EG_transcript_6419